MSIKVDPEIKKLIKQDKDTRSSEAQIVALTSRINQLNEHFKSHRHDQTSRRGLINIVGKRAKLLKYLRSNDNEKYLELTKALNIRK